MLQKLFVKTLELTMRPSDDEIVISKKGPLGPHFI